MPTEFEPNNNHLPIEDTDLGDDAIWDLLSLYADGEATPEQAAQVETLLCSDPRYARDLQFMRMTGDTIETFAEVEPPVALRDAIFAATTRRQTVATRLLAFWGDLRQSFSPRSRYMSLGGLAAATILAIALWPGFQTHNVAPQPSSAPVRPNFAINNPISTPSRNTPHQPVETPEVAMLPESPYLAKLEMPNIHMQADNSQDTPKATLVSTGGLNPAERKKPELRPSNMPGAPKPSVPNRIILPPEGETGLAENNIQPGREDWNRHKSPMQPITSVETGPSVQPSFASDPPKPDPEKKLAGNEGVIPAPPAPTPGSKIIRVATLPPEAYQILTNAQMKQQRDARTLGYDRDTVNSIQRKELTVSLIKGSL